MANEKNLIPFGDSKRTESEQREIQRKGGIASGEARRKKKLFREILEEQMNGIGGTLNGKEATRKELATYNMVKLITSGRAKDNDFIRAMEFVRDTIGEKPTERVEVSKPTSEIVQEMEDFFGRKEKGDSSDD